MQAKKHLRQLKTQAQQTTSQKSGTEQRLFLMALFLGWYFLGKKRKRSEQHRGWRKPATTTSTKAPTPTPTPTPTTTPRQRQPQQQQQHIEKTAHTNITTKKAKERKTGSSLLAGRFLGVRSVSSFSEQKHYLPEARDVVKVSGTSLMCPTCPVDPTATTIHFKLNAGSPDVGSRNLAPTVERFPALRSSGVSWELVDEMHSVRKCPQVWFAIRGPPLGDLDEIDVGAQGSLCS